MGTFTETISIQSKKLNNRAAFGAQTPHAVGPYPVAKVQDQDSPVTKTSIPSKVLKIKYKARRLGDLRFIFLPQAAVAVVKRNNT